MRGRPLLWTIITGIPISLVTTIAWFGVFTFVNGYLVRDLHYSNSDWTACTLWFVGAMIGWQLVCTEISAKIGRRATITAAMALTALGYLGLAITVDLTWIRICLVLLGFITAATAAAWLPHVVEIGGSRPGRAIAAIQLIGSVIGMGALIGGGYTIAGLNYRQAFLLFAGVCALCTIAFHLFSPAMGKGSGSRVVSLLNVSRRDALRLARGPALVILLLGVCIEPFNFHTVNQLFPNLARDVHGFTEKDISLTVALARISSVPSLLILARIIDRISALRCYGVVFLLSGACVVWAGAATGTGSLIAAVAVFYLFHGGVWGTDVASLNAAVETHLLDSAFAIMGIASLGSVFVVGFVHNRMLNANLPLPQIFMWCGLAAVICGLALFVYSFSSHSVIDPTDSLAVGDKPERDECRVG